MGESERASGRKEERIPLFCEKSLAMHLADAVIRDIGAICARREVGALSIPQAGGAIEERLAVLRQLRPDRTVEQLLERVEIRLLADVLDCLRASGPAFDPQGEEQERRERKEAKEREERIPSSNSNSKEDPAHSGDHPENTKCAAPESNSNSNSRSGGTTACPEGKDPTQAGC